ncbi:hypothetical protein KUCAC02_014807 [Chaenocephalus aceratus]|uniref:Uncharacterized protein n=1 Tax=Chaenocephalus aceratus TaxID=36190 RepID=A0ACB9WGL3_CHAAC|nr:hypothetical protein KUCAC02_014807 [Chaenocephalus aceratus]
MICDAIMTWHLPTLPTVPCLMTMDLLCLIIANSSELNSIENMWDIVKKKTRDTTPNNVDKLKATTEATCAAITAQQSHSHMDAVIQAGPTQ